MSKQKYSESELKNAITSSNSIREALLKLGITPKGGSYKVIHRAIKRYNIDASHLLKKSFRHNKLIMNKDLLSNIIINCTSYAQVIKQLNKNVNNGSLYRLIVLKIKEYKLDISHFTGKAWNKNKVIGYKHPIHYYLVNEDRGITSHKLKLRLISEKIFEHRCFMCGITKWMGKLTPIELDHINGNNQDNRLENLRILCPNCHAQTETYCSKNKK